MCPERRLPCPSAAFLALLVMVAGCKAGSTPHSSTGPTGPTGTVDAGLSPCTTDSQCPSGEVCTAGVCGTPVAPPDCGTQMTCTSNSQCPSMQCAQTGCCYGLCSGNSECPSTQECVQGVCRDIGAPCTSNGDCPYLAAPICDTKIGACVECVATTGGQNNECPAGQYCQNDVCVTPASNGCTTNTECTISALPYCNTQISPGQCVACLIDSNCPSGETCSNTVCVSQSTGCQFDADCINNPSGQYCTTSGTCVACLVNSNCPAGDMCTSSNTCTSSTTCVSDANCPPNAPHCRPQDHFCAECAINTQCPANQVCNNGYCEPAVNGCINNTNCQPPLGTCDQTTRTCVGCLTDADCPAFCVAGMCKPCSSDSQCLSNSTTLSQGRILCDDSTACVQCEENAQCSGSQVCSSAGMCVVNPVNQPCPSSGDCGDELLCVQDGTPTGTCRQECDPFSQTTCGNGLVCGLVGGENPEDVTAACQPSIPGSSPIGGQCSASQPCDRDGVCLPDSPTTSLCYPRCDPDDSNSSCSQSCTQVVILDPTNIPLSVGVCIPAGTLSTPCTSASDCSSQQVCIAEGNPSNPTTLQNECWYPQGSGAAGAGCSHSSDCQSGICLIGPPQDEGFPGFCEGACTSDSQCPALGSEPGACATFPAPWYDASGDATTTPINTCVAQCADSTEPCKTGWTCDIVADVSGTSWASRCVPVAPGGALGGALCYQNTDCYSQHCIPLSEAGIGLDGSITTGGVCAGTCNPADGTATNAACTSGATCPASGQDLDVSQGNPAPAPICWTTPCTTNEQCGPIGTCTGFPAPDNSADVVLECIPTQGTVQGGGSCTLDSDCNSGWCVVWGGSDCEPEGSCLCFGACDSADGTTTNPDCASGSTCYTGYWTSTTPHSTLSYCGPSGS